MVNLTNDNVMISSVCEKVLEKRLFGPEKDIKAKSLWRDEVALNLAWTHRISHY